MATFVQLRLTVMGIAAGLLGACVVTRGLQTMLFAVRGTNPATLAVVSALLLLVGLLARYIPARRATRVDP